jgi:hypothetical protein
VEVSADGWDDDEFWKSLRTSNLIGGGIAEVGTGGATAGEVDKGTGASSIEPKVTAVPSQTVNAESKKWGQG